MQSSVSATSHIPCSCKLLISFHSLENWYGMDLEMIPAIRAKRLSSSSRPESVWTFLLYSFIEKIIGSTKGSLLSAILN